MKSAQVALVLVVSFLMVLAPSGLVNVQGANCAGGLNPKLHITLLVPTSNPARRAWAAIVQNSLQCLGMDVARVELPFSPNIYARSLTPPQNLVGATFDQGGFDILFVGQNLGIEPDPWSLFHSSQYAPAGQNYYLWNNTQNDNLTNLIKITLDRTTRLNYVQQWQVLAYNELPSIPIFYDKEVVAFGSAFTNAKNTFTTYHYPAWPPIEHLNTTKSTPSFTLAETGQAPGQGVIPELSTSYYDLAISGEIFSALALRNDTIFKTMIPQLASGTPTAPGWTVSPDGKTWDVTLRPGVMWHDGQPLTATDVKFTFDLYQDTKFASPTGSFVQGIVGGKNNVTITGPMSVRFTLPAPYAYFVQNILAGTAILPAHILNSTSFYGGTIDYSRIVNSKFNRPDIGTFGSNPIGTGPYKWVGYDSAATTSHLTKNTSYFDFNDWGNSALVAKKEFGITDYYVRTIVGGDQAITALNNGEVDFLDSQYHLETQPSFLSSWTGGQTSYVAYGVQEMGVNMRHPVLGTGTATPYAQQHPGNATAAANAAKWIRQAISHAVPRDQIINSLLNGYGSPAITMPIVGDYKTKTAVTDGFNTNLVPYDYNLTTAGALLQSAGYTPIAATSSFIDQYGVYLIGIVVVAAVAIAAVFILRARRTPIAAHSAASTAPTTTSPS